MPILDWIGKDKVVSYHQDVPYRVLERKYAFPEADSWQGPQGENRIIRGDSLEAFKALLPEYEGLVNCILL